MSMEYSTTYSCSPNPTAQSVAGKYTHPQYVPMRMYAPMTPTMQNVYPSHTPMIIPSHYSQAVPYMSHPVPIQACSPPIPSSLMPMPTLIQTPVPMGSYPPQGKGSPTLHPMQSYSPSPVSMPSPASMIGVEGLGYSMGNLNIRAPSPSPARPCMPFVVMATPPSTGMMTPPPQFVVSRNYPSPHDSLMAAPVPQGPDFFMQKPRANRTRSRSPGSSVSRESDSSESPTAPIPRTEVVAAPLAEPSKRDLVNKAFARLMDMFGEDRFDQEGNRGENIVRLKVKTRNALEHIVPFIERCQQENLISTVSCPISTKKGRQQVRGFLAYLETRTAEDADRLEDLVREYNAENKSVFNTWHRNPVSTWKTESS